MIQIAAAKHICLYIYQNQSPAKSAKFLNFKLSYFKK